MFSRLLSGIRIFQEICWGIWGFQFRIYSEVLQKISSEIHSRKFSLDTFRSLFYKFLHSVLQHSSWNLKEPLLYSNDFFQGFRCFFRKFWELYLVISVKRFFLKFRLGFLKQFSTVFLPKIFPRFLLKMFAGFLL